jgi:hypothetical protein
MALDCERCVKRNRLNARYDIALTIVLHWHIDNARAAGLSPTSHRQTQLIDAGAVQA